MMVLFKYRLPNGNVFIWLGTGRGWGGSEGIDNVLVLAGGDVLFLETRSVLSLAEEEVRKDLQKLGYEKFAEKYELPANGELWNELKAGVEEGRYPPILQNAKEEAKDFQTMISAYIANILNLRDPNERIRNLEAIIRECQIHTTRIRASLRRG